MKAPDAGADADDVAVRARGELLRHDRARDERHAFDRRGHVADVVEPAIGRGEVGRRPDDRAADVADDVLEAVRSRGRLVARDAVEQVDLAGGEVEASCRDVRGVHPARRRERRDDERHLLVADAAGRMLLDEPAVVEAVRSPVEDRPGVTHRQRERHGLPRRHPVEVDGHEERADLAFGDRPARRALDECADLVVRQLDAVTLPADDVLGQDGRGHVSAGDRVRPSPPIRLTTSRWSRSVGPPDRRRSPDPLVVREEQPVRGARPGSGDLRRRSHSR